MLILQRKVGQKILIGDDIVITFLSSSTSGSFRVNIEAPRHISVDREEVRRNKNISRDIDNAGNR